jgi:hypothetical protein
VLLRNVTGHYSPPVEGAGAGSLPVPYPGVAKKKKKKKNPPRLRSIHIHRLYASHEASCCGRWCLILNCYSPTMYRILVPHGSPARDLRHTRPHTSLIDNDEEWMSLSGLHDTAAIARDSCGALNTRMSHIVYINSLNKYVAKT